MMELLQSRTQQVGFSQMQKILSLPRLVMITPTNLLVPHMILKRFSGLLLFDYLTVWAKDPIDHRLIVFTNFFAPKLLVTLMLVNHSLVLKKFNLVNLLLPFKQLWAPGRTIFRRFWVSRTSYIRLTNIFLTSFLSGFLGGE